MPAPPTRRPPTRLTLEPLEDRLVPSFAAVGSTTAFPFSATVQMDVVNDGQTLSCSGALIDSTHVLTAAHCLYDLSTGTLASSVIVSAGRDGADVEPYGTAHAIRVVVHGDYVSGRYAGTAAYDLGIVTLDRPLGGTVGAFSVTAAYPDAFFNDGGTISILEYPGDTHSGVNQYLASGPALNADANQVDWFLSDLPIEHGASGAPVYVQEPGGVFNITAVVSELSPSVGIATRINAAKYNWIENQLTPAVSAAVGPAALSLTPAAPAAPQTPGVFDPATGTWYLRETNTPGAPDIKPFAYGAPGWTPVVGDWNGDGFDTVGVVNPSTGIWYLRNSNSPGAPSVTPFPYGAPGWTPVVGDWDGDGVTSIGTFDPTTATWYLKNGNGPGAPDVKPFRYGAPGWIPVVGDWTGDGTTTIGVVDPATMTWYLKLSNGPGAPDIKPFQYGAPGWTPVVGDWNGDGTTTIGVVDPSGNTWYLKNTIGPGVPDYPAFAYGAPGWVPLAGDWNGFGAPQHTSGAGHPAAKLLDAVPGGEEVMAFKLSPEVPATVAGGRTPDADGGEKAAPAADVDGQAAGEQVGEQSDPLTDDIVAKLFARRDVFET